jgi:hypothetical protein
MFIAGLKNNCVRRTIPPPYRIAKTLANARVFSFLVWKNSPELQLELQL